MTVWFYSFAVQSAGRPQSFDCALTNRHPLLEMADLNAEWDAYYRLISFQKVEEDDPEVLRLIEHSIRKNGGEIWKP